VGRPSNILMACRGEQREKYLFPAVRGEIADCLAMTEPDVGSDLRGMKTFARKDGDDYVINGVKHFISHAEEAAFTVLFAATGEEDTSHGKKKLITAFLVDKGTPGFTVREGYRNVSHRGYTNAILDFDDCRLHKRQILGDVHQGFELGQGQAGKIGGQLLGADLKQKGRHGAGASNGLSLWRGRGLGRGWGRGPAAGRAGQACSALGPVEPARSLEPVEGGPWRLPLGRCNPTTKEPGAFRYGRAR
jgi:hypothetical protein